MKANIINNSDWAIEHTQEHKFVINFRTVSSALPTEHGSLNLSLDEKWRRKMGQGERVSTPTDADVCLALDGGLVKWRVVPVIPGVRVGTSPQQQGHHLGVTERAGVMQRNQPAVIPGVDPDTEPADAAGRGYRRFF